MYDEAELRQMSREERARLARALAALDAPRPLSDAGNQLRRRLLIAAAIACAAALAAWIGVLAVSLPPRYRAGGWQAAWVGFDIGLLAVFLAMSAGVAEWAAQAGTAGLSAGVAEWAAQAGAAGWGYAGRETGPPPPGLNVTMAEWTSSPPTTAPRSATARWARASP